MADRIKSPKVGDAVIFHDSVGTPHNALVTVRYSELCINAIFISGDESRQDSYGRQFERTATCNHKSTVPAHGNYWRWADEEPNNYAVPSAS